MEATAPPPPQTTTKSTKKIKKVKTKEAFSVNVSSKLNEIYPNGFVESAGQLDNPINEDQALDNIIKNLLDKWFASVIYFNGKKSIDAIAAAAAPAETSCSTTINPIETHMEKFYKFLRRKIDNTGEEKIVPIEFHRYLNFDNAVSIFNAAYDGKRKRLFPARMSINLQQKQAAVTFTEPGQTLIINTGFVIKIKNIVQSYRLNETSKKIETEAGKVKTNNAVEHIIVGDVKVNCSSSTGILSYPIFIDPTDTGLIMINLVNLSSEVKSIKGLNIMFYAIRVNDIPSENKVLMDMIKKKDMRYGRHLKNTKSIINVNDFTGRTLEVVVEEKKEEITFDQGVLFTVQKREVHNADYTAVPGIIDNIYPVLFGSEAFLADARDKLDFHNIVFLKKPIRLYCTVDANAAANAKGTIARKMDVKLLNGSAYNLPNYKALSAKIKRIIVSIDLLKSALDESSDIIKTKFPKMEQKEQRETKIKLMKLFDFYGNFKILEELSADDVLEKINMSDQNMYESRLDHKPPLSVSILRSLRFLLEKLNDDDDAKTTTTAATDDDHPTAAESSTVAEGQTTTAAAAADQHQFTTTKRSASTEEDCCNEKKIKL